MILKIKKTENQKEVNATFQNFPKWYFLDGIEKISLDSDTYILKRFDEKSTPKKEIGIETWVIQNKPKISFYIFNKEYECYTEISDQNRIMFDIVGFLRKTLEFYPDIQELPLIFIKCRMKTDTSGFGVTYILNSELNQAFILNDEGQTIEKLL